MDFGGLVTRVVRGRNWPSGFGSLDRRALQLNGVWIVRSDRTSDVIREALSSCLNLGDALLVVGAGQDAAWAGFKPAKTD